MSATKRLIELAETQRLEAVAVIVAARVASPCPWCGGVLLHGDRETERAYRLANTRYTAGRMQGVFENRRVMTDTIKQIVDSDVWDYCAHCDRLLEDD